jgi:hypothetical protein
MLSISRLDHSTISEMEVLTIESQAYRELVDKVNAIFDYIHYQKADNRSINDEVTLDSAEVCEYLNISKKTLQRLRTAKEISYSVVHGKYYYSFGDIKRMLQKGVIRSKNEYLENLANHSAKKRRLMLK